MGKIIRADELPVDEAVYLKKDWTGWRVVEPITDESGKLNWKRMVFGTKKERLFLGIILLIVLFGYLGFQEQLTNYRLVLTNPCDYCVSCQEQTRKIISDIRSNNYQPIKINISFPENG